MSTSHRGQPFALWLDQPRCLLSAAANRSSSSSARKRQQTKNMRVQSTRVRAVGGAERHRAPAHLRPAAACRPLPVHLAALRRACRRRCYAATHIPLYCRQGRAPQRGCQSARPTVSSSPYRTANQRPVSAGHLHSARPGCPVRRSQASSAYAVSGCSDAASSTRPTCTVCTSPTPPHRPQ